MPVLANNSGLVAFSMVVLVMGYLLVGALFYLMVYRPRQQEKQAEREAAEHESASDDD